MRSVFHVRPSAPVWPTAPATITRVLTVRVTSRATLSDVDLANEVRSHLESLPDVARRVDVVVDTDGRE